MNPTNPNNLAATHEHSGAANFIALAAAAGVLTTGLLANQPPHAGPEDAGVGATILVGGLSRGVLHPGTPAEPGDPVRTEHHKTEKNTLSVSFPQDPGSSFIDPGDTKKLEGLVKKAKDKQKQGWTVVHVDAIGRSSTYTTDPNSLPVKEPENATPPQDWAVVRSKALSAELDDIVSRANLNNVPNATEETKQDVLTPKEMKQFTKIARKAGYVGANAAHTATTDVLNRRTNNPAVKKAVEIFITDNMGGTAEVVMEKETTTFGISREPSIPGTPATHIVSYNQPPAKLPEKPKLPGEPKLVLLPNQDKRWPGQKIDGPSKGHGWTATHNKQPRFGKENNAAASRDNTGNAGRRGHNLRGNR